MIKAYGYFRLFHTVTDDWMKSERASAVIERQCPECGAPHGYYCRSETNTRVWPPHSKRMEK